MCLSMLMLTGPAAAQDLSVILALSPYAWVPEIGASVDTTWGTVEVNKSSSDVL